LQEEKMKTTENEINRAPIMSMYRTGGLAPIPDSGNHQYLDQHRLYGLNENHLPTGSTRSQVARLRQQNSLEDVGYRKNEGVLRHSLENARREQKSMAEEISSYILGDKEYPNMRRNVERRMMETGSPAHVATRNPGSLHDGDSSTLETRIFSRTVKGSEEKRFASGTNLPLTNFWFLICCL
jgi:hypothetical protein